MIRQCIADDFETIYLIINEAAKKYEDIIPKDRWKVPYMSREELRCEIEAGISFWGYEKDGELIGVAGMQHVQDVTLIRHAYVRTSKQKQGVGSKLLFFLCKQTPHPILIGTWADALWAIRFYENRGFTVVSPEEKNRLLRRYWSVPERQIETSVVLADQKWFDRRGKDAVNT
ncbi:MAG: GNAT family N-acetyltransferase [Desulfobacteraceae bacterium]